MPTYKYANFLQTSDSKIFDKLHHSGASVPYSGIYRCATCGFEITCEEGRIFPPEKSCAKHHAKWKCAQGEVNWQLAAFTIHTNTE